MKLALLVAFTLAGCVPPQQPSYFTQPGAGQPAPAQPGYGPPPPPAAATATASCQDTLGCYGTCNPMTDACASACDQRTTPESAQNAHTVLQCMAQSGCRDQNCVVQQCGAQITTCTNITLATAPAQPQPSGATGPDEVMTPEYSYGALVIPPPKRILQQSDFTGEWDSGAGTGQSYYDSGGNYTGSTTLSTADHWVIDAQGGFVDDWKSASTSSGAAFAHGNTQRSTGTWTANGNNTITLERAAHDDVKARTEYYIVVGWFVSADEITMEMQGPFYDPLTQQNLDDARRNSYMNVKYHRKR